MLHPRHKRRSLGNCLFSIGVLTVQSMLLIDLLFPCSTVVDARKMHNIYWNTTNPMFRIDNTDNIIDINKEDNLPTEYDQANIICPRYSTGTRQADIEKYIIYNVSRDEYENCRISQRPTPRVIALCDKPHQLMYFTITFRSFTPTPGGLEFKPGVDYFFISTSSRSDLHRKIGGRCTSHNMKLVFKVADTRRRHSNQSVNNHVKQVNVPRIRTQYHHYSDSDIKTSERFPDTDLLNSQRGEDTLRRSTLTNLKDFHSYLYPMRDILDLDSNSVDHSKRSQDYVDTKPHKQHNEVVKQEASVMHSGSNSVFKSVEPMCKRILAIKNVSSTYSLVLICGIITSAITHLMNNHMFH